MYLPIIGSFLETAGTVLERKTLKQKIDYRNYTVYEFLAIVIVLLPFLTLFWHVDAAAFSFKNLLIFFAVIVFSVLANLLIFYSLRREDMTEMEPIRVMQPLFTILIAFFLYSEERNYMTILLAVIASISLIFMHIKRNHFFWNKYMLATFLGSLFFAIELSISKLILPYYSSTTFYFLRCLVVFFITLIIFRPKLSVLTGRKGGMILITAAIWVLYRIILYYGYSTLGVIFTTMIMILSPILIMLYAVFFYKEKMSLKQMILTGVIIVCVAFAIVFGN